MQMVCLMVGCFTKRTKFRFGAFVANPIQIAILAWNWSSSRGLKLSDVASKEMAHLVMVFYIIGQPDEFEALM